MTNQPDDLVTRLILMPDCADATEQSDIRIEAAATIKELKAEVERITVQLEIESLPSMYCEACGSCGEPGCGCPKKCLYPGARAHLAEERAEEEEARAAKAEEALRECQDQLASTMSAEDVREKIQRELYECLCWWGTLPEPQGDVPERYHKWDDLGEIAERLIRAMPLTKNGGL